MSEDYLHQAAPGCKPERFSDKPLTVCGVRYFPNWRWSDTYRKEFAAWMREISKTPQRTKDDQGAVYLAWFIGHHGVSEESAREYIRETQGVTI